MENRKMMQAMFVEATIGILVVNKAGEIIKANPYSAKIFGYEAGELLNEKVEKLLPESFRSRHVQHRKGYYEKPHPRTMGANLELFGQRKDGTQFPIEISLSYMHIEGELYAIAYVSDDTVGKGVLQELRESKELLDEAQRLAHIGSFEMDLATGKDNWSEELYRIFGLDPSQEQISHEEFLSMVHPEDRSILKNFHEKIIQEKKGYDFGYRIYSKTNGLRYVEVKRDVKLNKAGEVIKIYGLLQDVTELQEVKKISEDISKIVEESLNEIYIFDAETLHFVQVNKGARQNIGYSLEEMKSMTPVDIKPEYDADKFLELMVPLQDGSEEILIFETVHQRKDKTTYPVEVHLQYSRIGMQPVYVAFIVDISERKKQQKKILEYSSQLEQRVAERTRELRESEAKLRVSFEKEKQLGELKSRFVSMASHEFRTPLSSILSSANLIGRYEKEDQQDKRMKHVKRIESSVRNLTIILNDFLSLEKLESGKVRYHPVELDFEEFIQQIIDEVNLTAKEGQVVIHQHIGNNKVCVDDHLVKNVLINLLSNGIKYSPNGKNVELNTQKENGVLKIQVKDYGMGIPAEDQQHMFTRFFRANNVTTIQGTGLGLTIVKRYLTLMDGKISFESEEGKGTTFFLEIPIP